MDAQIAKTNQSLTTAAEMRETMKMLMKPNANWEEYLTPAPLSIAIMGQLVFISSCDDFSINKNPPEGGFKYIKYPNSFRACLMQICHSGWHAFNEARNSMDQICIYTSTVPDYTKTAVHILFNASDDAIQSLLPCQLENIRTIADECVRLTYKVEKKYSDVINLIQELLEACINAKHFYGEELEKVKRKLQNDILVEMQNCKVTETDTKIKMLVKGLDAMGRVKEQWEKMVSSHKRMFSYIVKTSLNKTLHTFVTTSDETKELSYNDKLFAKDLLYNQTFQASSIASLVHMISETYTEVSNNYLMDRVSSLGRLMVMEKDSPQFLQERLNLEYSCQKAQDGILRLVLKNKWDFERKTDDRMAVIERQLKAILPAAPPQETE